MSLDLITVTQKRNTRVSDGAGGKTATLTTIATLSCTKNYYSRVSEARFESARGSGSGSGGPGVETRQQVFFKFEAPFPTVLVDDLLVDPDGKSWLVLQPPRIYSLTCQVDCELVQ